MQIYRKHWLTLGISLMLCVFLILPTLGACAKQAAPEPAKGEIIVGILDDLSGPMAGTYGPRKDGEIDAARHINEEQAGVLGHQIRCIVVDNKMDSTLMAAGWERLKNEKAVVVFSGMGVLPPVSQPAQDDKIPVFAGQGGAVDLLFPQETCYIFSQGSSLPGLIWSAFRQMENEWVTKGNKGTPMVGIDIITLGMQGIMSNKAAKMDMVKRGWPYVITRTSLAPADVTTQVLQMKNEACDYLLSISSSAALIAWLKELDRQNFHPVVYGTTNLGSPDIWDATGAACVGSRTGMNGPQWKETDLPLVSLVHELNSKWHPEVESRSDHYINGFAIFLAAVEGLREAIEEVGYENLNGVAVQQAVETIRDYDPGIGIGYTWTPNDHQGLHAVKWYERTEDGMLRPLTGDWDPIPSLPEEQRTNDWWMQD